MGLIPGLGRSPGEGHGSPLHYLCLENSIDRGTWWAIVHGVTKSQTGLKRLRMHNELNPHNSYQESIEIVEGKRRIYYLAYEK